MCCLLGKLILRPHLPTGIQTGVSAWGAACRKPTSLWAFPTSAFLRLKMGQIVKWALPGNHKIYIPIKLRTQLEVGEKWKCLIPLTKAWLWLEVRCFLQAAQRLAWTVCIYKDMQTYADWNCAWFSSFPLLFTQLHVKGVL